MFGFIGIGIGIGIGMAMPLAMALFGPLADRFPVESLLVAAGLALFADGTPQPGIADPTRLTASAGGGRR